ncbi:unnamed protein product [Euphydryas editha]|uniref:Reverse transcriptase domain-containing protein n=1 Tax=Euphydryas editha TaxID=104508 RepID=A0AAU9V8F2_EUPED|nr:unnamed protein product [Euphydryas editha]
MLIAKLEHFGIRGQLLQWISDFLTDRKFRVRVGDTLSETHNVYSGVPQGSVLGPILFGIFITDLKSVVKSYLSIFADDTKIMGNPLISHNIIQQDLDRIGQWTQDWLMSLNAAKCTVLHIGSNNPKMCYKIGSVSLKPVNSQKDLGVTITHNLKWDVHITNITKRTNSMLYVVRKAFNIITKDLFIKIYKTYIRPLLEYAFQIWNPYFKKDIEMLEKVQRRATKMVASLRHKTYEERLSELKLSTLEQRRQRGDLIETYKILSEHYNVKNIENMFIMNPNPKLRVEMGCTR